MQYPKDDGFFKLYRRYQKPIAEFVRSKIPNRETAAEITQEVFIKLFRFQNTYQKKYAFSTWLWTIARNTVADYGRAQVRVGQPSDYISPEEVASTERNPELQAVRKDQVRTFVRALRCLTHLQRRAVWMRLVHQLSYEEISKKLGISLNAAKNLTYRARITLSSETGLDLSALARG
jgi:RNA polymerase sigma-70 factor (ECF subfamily)